MTAVTETIGAQAESKDKPSSTDRRYDSMVDGWTLCRDVDGGQRRIEAATTKYLPKHAGEKWPNYQARLSRPTFFNAFSRTVSGLTGLVFRRDPQLGDDVPKAIKEHCEDIDLEGNHLDTFSREVFRDAMAVGMAGIFVDYPPNRAETHADELELGLRPYWRHIRVENILRVKCEFVNGRTVLKQVVFKETTLEDDGKFGQKEATHYRVFTRGWLKGEDDEVRQTVRWELWRTNNKSEFERVGAGYLSLPTIPLIPIYGGRKLGVFKAKPPLEDLAQLNILHYQTNSDYHHCAHIACVPIPVVRGASDDDALLIGPNTYLPLPDSPNAEAYYMETDGAALGHTRQMLLDMESRMASLGLNLLAREKRAAETAKARSIDKAEADSLLATAARSLEDGLELALQFHAAYMGLKSGGGSISVNRDYQNLVMESKRIRALTELVAQGSLSLSTLYAALQDGNVLPDTFDPSTERDKLAADVGLFSKAEPTEAAA